MSAPPKIERTESYQYPATHLGHLNADQANALEQFKNLAQDKGYYQPARPGRAASHDDETLLRYVRARKWNAQEAFAQFKGTEDWRKENALEQLYQTIDVADYDQARRLYPQWTGRRDKRGIPVYVFEVAHLNSKNISAYESSTSKTPTGKGKVPAKMMRLFALYENLTNFVLPLCSALPDRMYPETPVSQSNNIVDISKVGLKQFWNLKSHMQDASTLATAHYPETLDRIFIIGAPSFFPTVWSWIKKWFDPITVSKIFILSNADMKSTLEKYIEVQNIPKKYGGQLDFEFGQLPNLDPVFDERFKWSHPETQGGKRTLPTGPLQWTKAANGDLAATAVGSENGKRRNFEVGSLPAPVQAQQSSLGVDQPNNIYRTTSGISTHPTTPPAGTEEVEAPRDSSDIPMNGGVGAGSAIDGGSAAGLYHAGSQDIPVRSAKEPYQAPESTPSRDGTTATRFEQQHSTVAAGNMAEGTPTVRGAVEGAQHGVMEPNTVAQAPKEHPVPQVEEPAPTYMEQAQNVAGQAYTSAAGAATAAMAAMGIGEGKVESETDKTSGTIPSDPAVDNAQERNVEEFLRSQNTSKPAQEVGKV